MKTVVKTTNPALLSYVQTLLTDAGIGCEIFDRNISIVDGSIGIFPQRVMVAADDAAQARRVLADAGLGDELAADETRAG